MPADVLEQADHADRRRRRDRAAVGLVVEGDVAGDDRDLQGAAGVGDSAHRGLELAHDLRLLGISEVQAVGDRERPRSDAGDRARRLRDGQRRAAVGIESAEEGIDVALQGQGLRGSLDPHDRGVAPGTLDRVRADHVVVLRPDPGLLGHVRAGEDAAQAVAVIRRLRLVRPRRRGGRRGSGSRAVVERRLARERLGRQIGHDLAFEEEDDAAGAGHRPDLGGFEVPLAEDLEDAAEPVAPGDEEHPLLGLRQHDLVGRHARFADGNLREVELDPASGPSRHLECRGGQAGRAHVLDPDDGVGLEELEARLQQELLRERIAHLHGRLLLFRLVADEFLRGHRGAVDSVAPGPGAHVDDGIAGPFRAAEEDPVPADDPDVHHVDEDVAVEAGVERRLSADRRDPHAVAVAGDPANDPVHEVPHPRRGKLAEAQRVQGGDRAGAHREDVAQDSAHARRGSLVRLDEGGMIVRLHLEGRREPVADVHDSRVLSRPLDDPGPGRRELLQVNAGRFVGAVLAPHRGEDPELHQVGLAAQDLQDAGVLLLRQVVFRDQLGGDHRARVPDFRVQIPRRRTTR